MKNLLILILVIFSATITHSQEEEFYSALANYNAGKLTQAKNAFNSFVVKYKSHPKSAAAEYFISKILIEETNYKAAEERISKILTGNSAENYKKDFLRLKIKLEYNQLKYQEAFQSSVQLIEITAISDELAEIKTQTKKIAINHLHSAQLKKYADDSNDRKIKPFLLLVLGQKYLLENDNVNALKCFNEITSSYNLSPETKEAERFKSSASEIQSYGNKGILIGVMLPLTDADNKLNPTGHEILEGIKYAVSEYNLGRENKIGILVRDTKARKENIKAIKEEFTFNSSVRAAIGPVFSEEVRYALKEFGSVDLPIISPTATDEDLTSVSDYFFQANPPFSIRGRIFAQYLYYVENKRRMAVLNAIDGYSPLLASNFIDEFEKLGGRIIVKETYRSNSFSVSEQIKRINSFAEQIEGIYIPLSDKADATAILSQLVLNELDISLYGNQDWMLVKGFETSPELSNKLSFTSDYFIDYNDNSFNQFTSNFRNTTGKEVNRNVLYGYDTAKYLLTAIRNIDPSRKAIKLKIESGISSTGFKNNISFDQSRMNKFLNIVRYNDGVFLLVDKFRAGR